MRHAHTDTETQKHTHIHTKCNKNLNDIIHRGRKILLNIRNDVNVGRRVGKTDRETTYILPVTRASSMN